MVCSQASEYMLGYLWSEMNASNTPTTTQNTVFTEHLTLEHQEHCQLSQGTDVVDNTSHDKSYASTKQEAFTTYVSFYKTIAVLRASLVVVMHCNENLNKARETSQPHAGQKYVCSVNFVPYQFVS